MFQKATEYLTQLENNTNTVKNMMEMFYKKHSDFFGVFKNNDLDNSIFLLYYELNYLIRLHNDYFELFFFVMFYSLELMVCDFSFVLRI
jgi:hypothetical protein